MKSKKDLKCGEVVKSWRKDKKIAKKYCVNGKETLVHAGATGYSDFTKHKDPKRKKNFHARHKCATAKPGTPRHLACTKLW